MGTTDTPLCRGLGRSSRSILASQHAPVETKIKLSSIDEFVDELLDPEGRDWRRRAVQNLTGDEIAAHRT